MKTKTGVRFCLALAGAIGLTAYGESIPTSVTTDANALVANQNSDGNNNGFTNHLHWTAVSGSVVVPQNVTWPMQPNEAAKDKIYVVPSDRMLRTYKEPVANKVPGAKNGTPLIAGGKAWHLGGYIQPATSYGTTPLTFPSLTVYDSSFFGVNTSIGISNTPVIVKSAKTKPFYLSSGTGTEFVFDRCTFTGAADTGMKFRNSAKNSSETWFTVVLRSCDFTGYKGLLEINWPSGYDYAGATVVCREGTFSMPEGTVNVYSNAIVKVREGLNVIGTMAVSGTSTLQTGEAGHWQIGALTMAQDSFLSFQTMTQYAEPYVTVTGKLNLLGKPYSVSVAIDASCPAAVGRRFPLLRLASGVKDDAGNPVTLSADDFYLNAACATAGSLAVETADDGTQTLYFTEAIKLLTTSDAALTPTSGAFWSDGLAPHSGAWYCIPANKELGFCTDYTSADYTFPGLGMFFTGGNFALRTSPTRFNCPEIRVVQDACFSHYCGTQVTFPGRITVAQEKTLTMHEYSGGSDNDNIGDIFAGEVRGAGTISARWRGKNINYGRFEMTGLNTNFTGKVRVCCNGFAEANPWSSADYTPMSAKHLRVVVTDQRNFGGPIPDGATAPVYDALTVRDRQILHAKGNVVFDDATRGIYVPWWGRFRVDAGDTLALKQQLAYEGRVQKIGAGTLALGGTAKFTKNLLDTPYAGSTFLTGTNLLDITEGALKPLSTAAFAGVAVTFSNNTSIVLDQPDAAAADVAAYGIKATSAGSSIAVPNGTVKVSFAGTAPEGKFDAAVATFTTQAAADDFRGKIQRANVWTGWRVEFATVAKQDGDTTVYTVTASATPRGFFILIR